MASNRDILDAQRFNRARVTTAFTSGLPGGRELEPRSSVTPFIVGVVVAALIVVTALVLRRFSPGLPPDWQNDYLFVIQGTGARYYTIDGVMHPVTNITSAKLLTAAGQFHVQEVPASKVDHIPRGPEIGLADAPDDVPSPGSLTDGAWTSCAQSSAVTHTWIADGPGGFVPAAAALVSNNNATSLAVGGTRYPIAGNTLSETLTALGLVDAPVHAVKADWLNLLAPANTLGPLTIKGAGDPTDSMPDALAGTVIGSLVLVPGDDGTTGHFVVADADHLVQLTDVAYRLYLIGTGGHPETVGPPVTTTLATMAPLVKANQNTYPAAWPATIGDTVPRAMLPCVARPMSGDAHAVIQGAIPAASAPAASGPVVTVPGGEGVLLRVSNGSTFGAVRLVADTGFAYGIANEADTLGRLGFTADDVLPVPEAWAGLVPPKNAKAPALSHDTAAATVRS
ncbi:MAG: type VII secretion protein EccB [Actinomycetia bacterium]|nr:type VII secretion protein EccB [Actinomycetes bacterium]